MIDVNYILNRADRSGIILPNSLSATIGDMEEKYKNKHDATIWKGKNGRYMTYVEDITRPNGRRLISKKSEEELRGFLQEFYDTKMREPTVKQCFDNWLADKMKYGEIKEVTYCKYIQVYERFLKDTELANRRIKDINSHDLERFVKSSIHDYNLTSKGWADLRTILYGTFRYAKRNDYTDLSITYVIADMDIGRNIFRRKKMIDCEQVFTQEEVEKIINYALYESITPTILMLGVVLAFQTGMRVGEISTLKFTDLDGDILHVCRTETKVKRNGKWYFEVSENTKGRDGERNIVLTKNAKTTILMAKCVSFDSEYLFSKRGKRIESKQYTRCLYRICEQVGIPKRSMHKARKTYATTLLDAGVSPRIIMNQMGHTMIDTTEAYYHYNNKNVEQVKDILTQSLKF